MSEKLLLTQEEVSNMLGLDRKTVRGFMRDGTIPTVVIPGGKRKRIRRKDLERFLDRLTVAN